MACQVILLSTVMSLELLKPIYRLASFLTKCHIFYNVGLSLESQKRLFENLNLKKTC